MQVLLKIIRQLSLHILLIAMIFTGTLGTSCSSNKGNLSIFAAAGAKEPLDVICQSFEERYDIPVTINYGGGGEVLSQMMLSRIGDVYIAPEQCFMETAVAEQAIDPHSIINFAYMIPVVAVKEGNPRNINSFGDLAKPEVKVAICRPETTLLGHYAIEIFEQADLANEIGHNINVQAARPDSLLTMLIMGQVDAAIIWHFYENQASEYIDLIYLYPNELTGVGKMQAAISTYNSNNKPAKQFLEFLLSESSKVVFKNAGYIVDEKEVQQYWQ